MTGTKTKENKIIAYKVFNPDWTCRGFQFEVGKTYVHKGTVKACSNGFHACLIAVDCFSYYSFDSRNKVAVVELSGKTDTHEDDTKIAAEKIKIVRELNWHEVLELVNTGKDCTGLKNSGNRNSGDGNSGNRNSGDGNSGNRNSGDGNSGNGNSGNRNSGNRNSGNWNSGNRNSGDGNSGNWNSGNWNSGNWNSGDGIVQFFCTETPQIRIFDKPTSLTVQQIYNLMPSLWNYDLTSWVESSEMSDTEKEDNPQHGTSGGFLKRFAYKEMCANGWAKDDDENKLKFFRLPNFDLQKFEEITGINAKKDYKRLVK